MLLKMAISITTMVDQQIVNYIKQQQKAGYDINAIRTNLINYGYDAAKVEEAIKSFKKKSPLPLYAMAIGVVILVVITVLFFIGGDEPVPLQLDTSSFTDELKGDTLGFSVLLTGEGSYSVRLQHEVLDSSGRVLNSKQENLFVNNRLSNPSSISLPSLSDGSYTLKTTAFYDTSTVVDSFIFNVKTEVSILPVDEPKEEIEIPIEEIEVVEKICPISCDDRNSCTQDFCSADTGFNCLNVAISPCCGNNVCDVGESFSSCAVDCSPISEMIPAGPQITVKDIINDAKSRAVSSPSNAETYCKGLEKEYHKGSCFNAVAEETKQSSYCAQITSETSRDNCYTNFALEGDYTVCGSLTNKYLKQSCEALAEAQSI